MKSYLEIVSQVKCCQNNLFCLFKFPFEICNWNNSLFAGSGKGSYMLDRRLDIVPVHGPYSDCPVCKSGQQKTNNKDDYIR